MDIEKEVAKTIPGPVEELLNNPSKIPRQDASLPPVRYDSADQTLSGGGEMGALMRALDWNLTSLGQVDKWPQSLRTAVSICLNSRFPILLWWGSDLTMLYNDAYRPMLGTKHPRSMGQPGRECWPEIWDIIGPMLEGVLHQGLATWSDNQLLLLNRNGFTEECFFTFSYSPIRDESGKVGGVFTAVTETTASVVGARRLDVLSELAARATRTKTELEACRVAMEVLAARARQDIPFALLYGLEYNGAETPQVKEVNLVESIGIKPDILYRPEVSQSGGLLWSLAQAEPENRTLPVKDLAELLGGPFTDNPENFGQIEQALILQVNQAGQALPAALLVVGLSPLRLLDDDYRAFLGLVRDHIATAISNARSFEEERKRAEALAEIDRAKTTFFSNVSHEFRTPLTLMLAPIEDMLNEASPAMPDYQRQRLETLHRNSLRLLKLVNGLLDFSRIEAGRIQAVYAPTDLAGLTTDLASAFRSVIEKAGMKLIVDCPPLDRPVYIDHDMWEKIVLNLLSNAFKFTLAGQIAVSLRPLESTVELKVTDTGLGISESELPHIFERFHRAEGVQGRTYEGSGIGLSLVQELVKLHGGSIAVQSQPGQGSVFTVSIPLGKDHLPPERIKTGLTLSSNAGGTRPYIEEALRWLPQVYPETARLIADLPDGLNDTPGGTNLQARGTGEEPLRKAAILLADDNADMREYLNRLLSQYYEVTAVGDGQQALDLALSRPVPFDLVLTDVMMPNLDGFGLIKELRNNSRTRTTPLIILSARAGEEAASKGMEARADDYLVKPFSARELLARVGAHLEMAEVRREAARQIQQIEDRLASVVNNSPIILWALDKDGIFTIITGKGLESQNLKPNELVGRSYFEVYRDQPDLLKPVRRALKGEKIVDVHQFSGYWYEVYYSPNYNEQGEINGIVAVSTDITERKKAEEAREATLRQLQAILEQLPAGVLIAQAPDGQVILSNPQANKIWGHFEPIPADFIFNENYRTYKPDGTPYLPTERPLGRALYRGEVVVDEEITIRRDDGTFATLSAGASPITDQRGQITAAVVVFIDITERKKLEKQKDDFIAVASHELKTPVTSLKAYSQVLLKIFERKGETRVVEQLARMDNQINKLTTLITDLLDVTRLQSGKLQFKEEWFDFNELVVEIVGDVQRAAESHTILKELGPQRSVFADRDRTGQVLINLIMNAVKYSPQSDKVIVRTFPESNQVVFSVQDFGIGIAADKQARLFERFYRVSEPKQETFPGLGLGLYISSQIIARQNGKIWLESSPGVGSTFYFSLPTPLSPEENPSG